jgi:5-formyltetrahydrofolate cyclo-ligase
MNHLDAKKWLRSFLLQERRSVGPKQQKAWSLKIQKHVISLPVFKRARVVAVYIGFGSEVFTGHIIEAAWKAGKQVLVPVSRHGLHKTFFVTFERHDKLMKTAFGPMEIEINKEPVHLSTVDMVIVPGLGFDSDGHRLGYGGGVYDRILKKTPRAHHVGLFFSTQFVRKLPCEKHDHPLSLIVTENGQKK